MKVTELSVSDWINIDGEPIKVEDIYNNGGTYRINYDSICIDDVEPVALTNKMLNANGFKICRNVLGFAWVHQCWTFKCNEEDVIYLTDGNGHIKLIKYVHELQHILRVFGYNELADNFKIQE